MIVCIVSESLMFFFFKQKTAYEMRISDWSPDVCSSDLDGRNHYFRATKSRLRSNRLRDPATILSVKGRHADTNVPYPPRGGGAERQVRGHAALRLWRVQNLTDAGFFGHPPRLAWAGRRGRHCEPVRGPRISRGVARCGRGAEQPEGLR